MTSHRFIAIAVVLSTASATPVFAQAAIQEPGAYAFYHPNSDLGLGSTRPAAGALASIPLRDDSLARLQMMTTSPHAARHSRAVKSN